MRMIGILFGIVVGVHAGASIRWQGNYDKALAQARAENKALMVLVVKPASAASNQFLTRLRHFPKLIDRVNRRWVSVIAMDDHRRNYPNELYYTTTYPTLFWVDPRDERFLTSPVTATPETLRHALVNLKPLRRYP